MKKSIAITVVVLLSSALFLVGVCVAGAPVLKPLIGNWTGTLYSVGLCPFETDFPILTVNIGKGVASGPLGSSNFVFVYCVDVTGANGYGWGIITTANGDKLHVSITNLNATPPTWSEEEEIVGGTGMFENASGRSISSGTYTSEADPFPGIFTDPTAYPPPLLQPAQGWIGTTEGKIEFPR